MSLVKVTDIAYGRLRVPDLDVMEEFLTRFGLRRSERTANALYMRGTDPNHHIHVTEKGDPKFVGLAYYVESEDDLKRLTKAPGASGIETIDEPGGGKRVRLCEPNGYQIEVVCGVAPVPEISVRRQKLRHLLLLAMRCLALAIVVAAFARPFFQRGQVRTAAGMSSREVVLSFFARNQADP